MNKRIIASFVCSVFVVLSLGNLAWAKNRVDDDDWHFTLAPLFLWGISLDGTSQIGPVSGPLDLSFTDDIFENLSGVFTLHFEAQKRDWTIFSEYQYVDLDPSTQTPAGPVAEIDFTINAFELGVAYKTATFGINDLELIGGARYAQHDMEVRINPGPLLVDVNESWWDAFIGLRIFTYMSEKWTFVGRADIGAGGSDLVWNLSGIFDYQFKDWGSVFLGYRWLDYDYDSGDGLDRYAYDALQQGPLLGLGFYW